MDQPKTPEQINDFVKEWISGIEIKNDSHYTDLLKKHMAQFWEGIKPKIFPKQNNPLAEEKTTWDFMREYISKHTPFHNDERDFTNIEVSKMLEKYADSKNYELRNELQQCKNLANIQQKRWAERNEELQSQLSKSKVDVSDELILKFISDIEIKKEPEWANTIKNNLMVFYSWLIEKKYLPKPNIQNNENKCDHSKYSVIEKNGSWCSNCNERVYPR